MIRVECEVNGRAVRREVEDRLLLSDFLRHDLGLRGTHVGCEHGVCGACTVRVDGAAMRSCLLFAAQVDGCRVETVEGLAGDGPLTALQTAFQTHHGLQCGFCTPGILMSAAEVLERGERPDRAAVDDLLGGHLCRCTGYEGIAEAILAAVRAEGTT